MISSVRSDYDIITTMEFDEQQLLPFHPTKIEGESILVLAPHPDDEVIGCGGVLAQASADGRAISVIVVTDGVAADNESSPDEYKKKRETESRNGLHVLGIDDVEFLGLPDRGLATRLPILIEKIDQRIAELGPDLILAPAPFDIHPDHHMVARAVWELCQKPERARELRDVTVAFYETSQPLLPNSIVDITEVAEQKFEAIRAHQSQEEVRDYAWFAEGLSRYRALTMPPHVRHAEAYRQLSVREIGIEPWSRFVESLRPATPPSIEVQRETIPVTIVVRTRNRPELLRQALESIGRGDYPCEVVVVNDGGEKVGEIVRQELESAKLIEHDVSHGRAAAANHGVEKSETRFIAFLDDDDLHYQEHLPTLASVWKSDLRAVYTDAVSAFYSRTDDGDWTLRDSMRLYTHDYDPSRLLVDNYIPLPTLLLQRDDFLELKGFDERFDLFEDWEYLIRLSSRGPFLHVPRVTCEIRHFEGSDSAILGSPEGSSAFRDAKRNVWNLHREKLTDDVLLDVYEQNKKRTRDLDDRLMNEIGRSRRLESDVRRTEREIRQLHARMGEEHERASAAVHELGGRLQQSEKELSESRDVIQRASADIRSLQERVKVLEEELSSRERVIDERDETLRAHFEEIRRLNGILDQIYASRTWKLHLLAEKLKGR